MTHTHQLTAHQEELIAREGELIAADPVRRKIESLKAEHRARLRAVKDAEEAAARAAEEAERRKWDGVAEFCLKEVGQEWLLPFVVRIDLLNYTSRLRRVAVVWCDPDHANHSEIGLTIMDIDEAGGRPQWHAAPIVSDHGEKNWRTGSGNWDTLGEALVESEIQF